MIIVVVHRMIYNHTKQSLSDPIQCKRVSGVGNEMTTIGPHTLYLHLIALKCEGSSTWRPKSSFTYSVVLKEVVEEENDCSWKATRSHTNLLPFLPFQWQSLTRFLSMISRRGRGRGPKQVHRLTNTYKYVSKRWIDKQRREGGRSSTPIIVHLLQSAWPSTRWGASPANQIT